MTGSLSIRKSIKLKNLELRIKNLELPFLIKNTNSHAFKPYSLLPTP
ncbi:MAG: hypothetical protein F6K54_31040 [Okeania sp. SIO3B5]|nr:hypothetical protein [Okeania sp. SIO3B5]NEO57120.1 hypothetical protein [Okeania sp. SIO3B5]